MPPPRHGPQLIGGGGQPERRRSAARRVEKRVGRGVVGAPLRPERRRHRREADEEVEPERLRALVQQPARRAPWPPQPRRSPRRRSASNGDGRVHAGGVHDAAQRAARSRSPRRASCRRRPRSTRRRPRASTVAPVDSSAAMRVRAAASTLGAAAREHEVTRAAGHEPLGRVQAQRAHAAGHEIAAVGRQRRRRVARSVVTVASRGTSRAPPRNATWSSSRLGAAPRARAPTPSRRAIGRIEIDQPAPELGMLEREVRPRPQSGACASGHGRRRRRRPPRRAWPPTPTVARHPPLARPRTSATTRDSQACAERTARVVPVPIEGPEVEHAWRIGAGRGPQPVVVLGVRSGRCPRACRRQRYAGAGLDGDDTLAAGRGSSATSAGATVRSANTTHGAAGRSRADGPAAPARSARRAAGRAPDAGALAGRLAGRRVVEHRHVLQPVLALAEGIGGRGHAACARTARRSPASPSRAPRSYSRPTLAEQRRATRRRPCAATAATRPSTRRPRTAGPCRAAPGAGRSRRRR